MVAAVDVQRRAGHVAGAIAEQEGTRRAHVVGGVTPAFAIIAFLASGFFREELEDESSNVKSLAGAFSFLSVGLALGVAYVGGLLIPGLVAWLVSAFLASVFYVASVGLELTMAHWILSRKE